VLQYKTLFYLRALLDLTGTNEKNYFICSKNPTNNEQMKIILGETNRKKGDAVYFSPDLSMEEVF